MLVGLGVIVKVSFMEAGTTENVDDGAFSCVRQRLKVNNTRTSREICSGRKEQLLHSRSSVYKCGLEVVKGF